MDQIDTFFKAERAVHESFGYKEDWVKIPIADYRDCYWAIKGEGPGFVVYSEEPLTKESIAEGKTIYQASIYTQRFLPKWVYRTDKHTMVAIDTHTDGNRYLAIFENGKEQKGHELIEAYEAKW